MTAWMYYTNTMNVHELRSTVDLLCRYVVRPHYGSFWLLRVHIIRTVHYIHTLLYEQGIHFLAAAKRICHNNTGRICPHTLVALNCEIVCNSNTSVLHIMLWIMSQCYCGEHGQIVTNSFAPSMWGNSRMSIERTNSYAAHTTERNGSDGNTPGKTHVARAFAQPRKWMEIAIREGTRLPRESRHFEHCETCTPAACERTSYACEMCISIIRLISQ